MRRCQEAAGLILLAPFLLLASGCAGGFTRHPEPIAIQPIATRFQADTKPFTDLRIPKDSSPGNAGALDPLLAQAGASAPPSPAGSGSNSAPLKFPEPLTKAADDPATRIRELYRVALQSYAGIDSYIARLRRREQVNGRDRPEEVILLKFRKQPFSVYLKWLGKENAGREVIYVKGQYEDKIHTLLAAGDMPLTPAGKRIALSPESIFVRSASRHSIHETGFGTIIESLGAALEAMDKGSSRGGSFKYLGPVKRPEFEAACEAVEHLIPAGVDPQLPRGGRGVTLFDATTRLPALLVTQDETGREVEYYCFDRLQYPVRLDDEDFNPDKLWPTRPAPAPADSGPPRSPGDSSAKTKGTSAR